LEIERQKLRVHAPLEQPKSPEELRARQLKARDMLRGDLTGEDLEKYVEERVVTTTLEKVLNSARAHSVFPATFGLACCAIEMMSTVSPRYDIARFGAEAFRASPRQADLLLYGFTKLQQKIMGNPEPGWRSRYNAHGTEEWARGGPASQPSEEALEAYAKAREVLGA